MVKVKVWFPTVSIVTCSLITWPAVAFAVVVPSTAMLNTSGQGVKLANVMGKGVLVSANVGDCR